MFDFGRDEDDATCGNFAIFAIGLEARAAAHHVIHFVLMMGPLKIETVRGQHVKAGAHATLRALPLDVGKLDQDSTHAKMPPKIRSVNCGMRFCACRSPSGLYH